VLLSFSRDACSLNSTGESAIAYIQSRISEIVAKLREPERPP